MHFTKLRCGLVLVDLALPLHQKCASLLERQTPDIIFPSSRGLCLGEVCNVGEQSFRFNNCSAIVILAVDICMQAFQQLVLQRFNRAQVTTLCPIVIRESLNLRFARRSEKLRIDARIFFFDDGRDMLPAWEACKNFAGQPFAPSF